MALAEVEGLAHRYLDGRAAALSDVSLTVDPGEVVALLGPSGSGKSTLIRALAGLVPHFHGGRFSGSVRVAGLDTRTSRPVDLAGTVATVFQDPEDQIVMTGVLGEVAFGLENLGVRPSELEARALAALEAVGAADLAGRRADTLSGGELQRVCLAAALAVAPRLLLLDEPTSQLDPEAADRFVALAADLARERGTAVVLSEQRPARALANADRVVFLDRGRVVLDAQSAAALSWLRDNRPAFAPREAVTLPTERDKAADGVVCGLERVTFAYRGGPPVLDGVSLDLRRGEVVALTGRNGAGKTTLARLAAGLLMPDSGASRLTGRAGYLPQDSGRYLVSERVDDEVGLGGHESTRALRDLGLVGFEHRHPRDLSSGERERVSLAAVLAPDPDLLVLDEPTRGMDPERKEELAALVRAQARRRATLVVTHDLVFAGDVADREIALGTREAALV
jgi:energy-coupling factor transport system ATP-binding protein